MTNYQYITRWVADNYQRHSGVHVLDYGCGKGTVVSALRDEGYECYGCDAFVEIGKLPKDYVSDSSIFGDWIFDMPGGKIPFGDGRFDVVINNQVMEHVEDIEVTLSEIHRVLKPGGVVLSLFPHKGVWREGHCGIAFIHWFPKGSRARFYYALALRSLGFGYHKRKYGSHAAWTENRCRYIDEQTFYKSMHEIHAIFGRRFSDLNHIESSYARRRFGERLPFLSFIPDGFLSLLVRVGGGCVFTCRKPR